jgi:hypothetical protein
MEKTSPSKRQQIYREKRRQSGEIYRSYWASPEIHEKIKQLLKSQPKKSVQTD